MKRNLPTSEPRNRVIQVRRFGGPEELEVVDAPLSTAGRDEVRGRVLASSVEYADVLIRRHLYPQTLQRRPPNISDYGTALTIYAQRRALHLALALVEGGKIREELASYFWQLVELVMMLPEEHQDKYMHDIAAIMEMEQCRLPTMLARL